MGEGLTGNAHMMLTLLILLLPQTPAASVGQKKRHPIITHGGLLLKGLIIPGEHFSGPKLLLVKQAKKSILFHWDNGNMRDFDFALGWSF